MINVTDGNVTDGVTVYSDGACSGNPGPGGWGAVILYGGAERRLSGGEKLTTNNRMELFGAIGALSEILADRQLRSKKIIFFIDSQYVKNGISSWILKWKANGWKTADKKPVKNKDLWERLDACVSQLDVDWRWVKGHAGSTYNELCDRLAVEASRAVR